MGTERRGLVPRLADEEAIGHTRASERARSEARIVFEPERFDAAFDIHVVPIVHIVVESDLVASAARRERRWPGAACGDAPGDESRRGSGQPELALTSPTASVSLPRHIDEPAGV